MLKTGTEEDTEEEKINAPLNAWRSSQAIYSCSYNKTLKPVASHEKIKPDLESQNLQDYFITLLYFSRIPPLHLKLFIFSLPGY